MTASERLSLEEEREMQIQWRDDPTSELASINVSQA